MTYLDSWVGAPTPTGFTVAANVSGATSVTLRASEDPYLGNPSVAVAMTNTYGSIWKATVTGLLPNARYYWGLAEDNGLAIQRGSAKTAPDPGAASFSFWSSSCAQNGSTHAVFSEILGHDPHFGLMLGDLHYQDIATNSVLNFHNAYSAVLQNSAQGPLYRNVATVYAWDDHDYGPDNSSFSSPSRAASVTAYRQRVPHFPLNDPEGIWQTFVYGRIRFIIFDSRSMRNKEQGSMLSAAQKTWFKSVLSQATEPVAVIATIVPWIGTSTDAWPGFPAERQELAEWLVANGWKGKVVFVAGDAHSIAYDDGTNNTIGGLHCPIFQTAALDMTPTTKGGTYTRPQVLNRGQYGLWEVEDTGGDAITMRLHAYSNGARLYTETLTFAAEPTAPLPQPPSEVVLHRTDGTPVVFQRTDGTSVALQPA